MQIVAETKIFQSLLRAALSVFSATVQQSRFSQYEVVRRNGAIMAFGSSKILAAASAPLHLGCQTRGAPNWD